MKYVLSLWVIAVLLLLSQYLPCPTSAYNQSSSKPSNEITLDRKHPRFLNQKIFVQVKIINGMAAAKAAAKVAKAAEDTVDVALKSSAVGEKTSMLQVYFALSSSIFFAFFLL